MTCSSWEKVIKKWSLCWNCFNKWVNIDVLVFAVANLIFIINGNKSCPWINPRGTPHVDCHLCFHKLRLLWCKEAELFFTYSLKSEVYIPVGLNVANVTLNLLFQALCSKYESFWSKLWVLPCFLSNKWFYRKEFTIPSRPYSVIYA